MRRIIDIKEILVSAISVIPDTVVFVIAGKCGLSLLPTLIVSLLPSMLGVKLIGMFVDKLLGVGKAFAWIIVTLMLVLSGGLLRQFGDEDVWGNLLFYIIPVFLISIITAVIVSYKTGKAKERVARDFEKSGGKVVRDNEVVTQIMDGMKGENREITGKYPRKNTVVCENGAFVGKRDDGVLSFKGIPYAQPPVGELRWREPQRVKPSEKVFEAYYYGNVEPQPYRIYSEAFLYAMSEDCLTLNVWKSTKAPKNCPVTVWVDTVDWCAGGTASEIQAGDEFVRENPEIIYVNINFRLGLFANMDFTDVPGGEAYPDAKNLGLKDIIEALRWINRNIAAFGGDPHNVTLVGGKGGGAAAVLLAANGDAKGLFRRVVNFGGSLSLTNDMEYFRMSQKEAREHLDAKTMDDFLQLPAEQLAGVLNEIESLDIGFPVADGITVPVEYVKSFEEASALGVDMLFCIASDEVGLLSIFNLDNIHREYVEAHYSKLPEQHKQCIETYAAQYYKSDADIMGSNYRLQTDIYYHYPMLKVCQAHSHAGGIGRYLVWDFKSPVEGLGYMMTMFVLRNREDYYEFGGVAGDPLVFSAFRRMLANFARTGDPSLKYGEVKNVGEQIFPAYDYADGSVTVLTENGLAQDEGELSQRIKQLEPLDSYLL